MSSSDEDAKAKQFEVPADKSRIYVYRNESLGGAIKVPITLDGQMVGQTARKTYFIFDVSPGKHEVGCVAETSSKATVDALPGKIAFVWQEMKMGTWAAACAMHLVDEATGKKGVSECNLAQAP
jgi:Protein of unknown function (DUF2846)